MYEPLIENMGAALVTVKANPVVEAEVLKLPSPTYEAAMFAFREQKSRPPIQQLRPHPHWLSQE
jgi:hypothetical protein